MGFNESIGEGVIYAALRDTLLSKLISREQQMKTLIYLLKREDMP
jgi:hypothetical protein